MPGHTQSVAVGVAQVGLATAGVVLAFSLLVHAGRLAALGQRLLRRTRPTPAIAPLGPPIERIVSDLRRLAKQLAAVPSGTTQVRRRGMQLAYDEALVCACTALDVEHALGHTPPGWARDLERLRVETCLQACGLQIYPVGS